MIFLALQNLLPLLLRMIDRNTYSLIIKPPHGTNRQVRRSLCLRHCTNQQLRANSVFKGSFHLDKDLFENLINLKHICVVI